MWESTTSPLAPGDPEALGPYRVAARLGSGGMGTVYLAHAADGRPVAIKVIRPELVQDPGFRARFAAEIEAARRVTASCTARVLDADPRGARPWFATEYVEGTPLDPARRPAARQLLLALLGDQAAADPHTAVTQAIERTSVSCGHDSVGHSPLQFRASGQFCLVRLQVRNIGNQRRRLPPNQYLVDTAGARHGADLRGRIALPKERLWRDLDPDDRASGTLVFDVPRSVRPDHVILHDSVLSGGMSIRLRRS